MGRHYGGRSADEDYRTCHDRRGVDERRRHIHADRRISALGRQELVRECRCAGKRGARVLSRCEQQLAVRRYRGPGTHAGREQWKLRSRRIQGRTHAPCCERCNSLWEGRATGLRDRDLRRHGVTSVFQLGEAPLMEKATLLFDTFSGGVIDPQSWAVVDSGGHISLTARGLTLGGGQGASSASSVAAVDAVEMGGVLLIELSGLQIDSLGEGYFASLSAG